MSHADDEISVMKDMLDEFADKLRHYPDAEMGWGADELAAFERLSQRNRAEAVAAGFWWAR
ncbi:hypothetical protein ABZ446_28485 [Streptomyces sp. NPDC005813]|uniref:hypothetical protein n=1 Tax=Streptomyces sp. NPDC005813 TaxID=3155592 RepID=UPI0033EF073F